MDDKAKKYQVEADEEEDTLAPLASDGISVGLMGGLGRMNKGPNSKVRMSLMANQLPKMGPGNKRVSTMLTAKSNKVRQSVALFSRESFMIKPASKIQKKNAVRQSMMFGGLNIDLTKEVEEEDDDDLEDMSTSAPVKRAQTTRTSVFNRISQGRKGFLEKQSPVTRYILDCFFAYYDFWEYYTAMTFFYLLAMFMVFNPFSEEVCGEWPCFPGHALDVPPVRAVLLLIAKWTAAATYVLFAELVFIYSRISLGHMQLTPLHMYVPYMMGSYHDAHWTRGWWFVACGWIHTLCHFIRVALDAKMPLELWISGAFLCFSLTCIMILASRNFNLCCMPDRFLPGRWARGFFRNYFKWEYMRILHLVGVFGMAIAAYWHKFPDGTSPLKVTFYNRFFVLYIAICCYYTASRLALWYFTVQIDIVTHTVYKSCQLIVIRDFPYAKRFCNHGRAWFSADAKVMFPDVHQREWHPFTCVVNSKTGAGYLLIKNYGDWSAYFTQVPASFIYMRTPPIKMSVEIPAKYTSVLVVASGTFITTVAGTVARAISLGDEEQMSTQDITILWVDREPIMIALVCLRLLSEFTNTDFRIYCTTKQKKVTDHLDEIQIMSTVAANVDLVEESQQGPDVKCRETDVNKQMQKATQMDGDQGDVPEDVQTMLENVCEDFPHITIHSGRPPMEEIFDELRPDFVFCGAAPPVARQVLGLAEKNNIDYRTSSYL